MKKLIIITITALALVGCAERGEEKYDPLLDAVANPPATKEQLCRSATIARDANVRVDVALSRRWDEVAREECGGNHIEVDQQ